MTEPPATLSDDPKVNSTGKNGVLVKTEHTPHFTSNQHVTSTDKNIHILTEKAFIIRFGHFFPFNKKDG